MDRAAIASAALDLIQGVAGPAVGATIALIGIAVNQRMQRETQQQSRHREEVRDLAASLLTHAESLWRCGWEVWQASHAERQAREVHRTDATAEHEVLHDRVVAMRREGEVHQEVLSAQRRLMLVSPALDAATMELVAASRLWPPPIERPGTFEYSRREVAESDFILAVRKELGTAEPDKRRLGTRAKPEAV